ncbi:MAG: tetratricopeptide repeat protein [Bacteroidetes bacterium]|nr:tetratricopeptide repeat protein [Bacteroidota bacterium]MBU1113544.1 tetratricopeptide repeat protein [Bacteroidota bacterium]MBU1800332.1 tetratricopeptide repeat protein [Bacteroidota bacterium]
MNIEINKIKLEYSKILEEYLGKTETDDLINNVFSEYLTDAIKSKEIALINFSNSFKIRSVIDRIITSTEAIIPIKKHIQLLLNLAKISLNRGDLFLSSDIYSQILLRTTNMDKFKNEAAFALIGLSEVSSLQAKWNESFGYVRKAKKIFENLNNMKGVARCENILGTFYAERGVLDSARQNFESGLEKLKGKNSDNLDALILINLGILNSIVGEVKEAEKNYRKALSKFEKANDLNRIASTHHNLGMLFSKMGNYESALEEFNTSVDKSNEDKNLITLAISYLGKAYIYAEKNELELASEFAEQSMNISNQINDRLTIADIYRVKGIIERKSQKYNLSESYLLTSLRINSELGNKLNYAETAYELGVLYLASNQTQSANKYLDTALKYYKKIKSVSEIKKIESLLTK